MKSRQAGNSYILTKFSLFVALLIACTLCFDGCKHASEQNNNPPKTEQKISLIELLLGKKDGIFRNVTFGIDPKTVKASEKRAPDETDTNYIAYTMPIDTVNIDSVNEDIDSVSYFNIAYNFDQQKLNEIDEDVFVATDSVAAGLAQRLSNYFTGKYGESASGSDAKVWSFSSKGKKMKVTLSDQSEEYDYGKLSLVFYCEDY
jgi:hypothetical protein